MSSHASKHAGDPGTPYIEKPSKDDPYHLGNRSDESSAPGHGAGGPASKRIVVGYGFWIFLISDIIMFSAFFAAYTVLRNALAGGPAGRDLFDLPTVAAETALLLISSFFCGMAGIALTMRRQSWFQVMMAITGICGAAFLALELREFAHLISIGAGPSRSAFLSSFFTLVGCHGGHVGVGLLWLMTMMAQIYAKGFRPEIERRFLCFALFWHALDIVWVGVFTVVYLFGAN